MVERQKTCAAEYEIDIYIYVCVCVYTVYICVYVYIIYTVEYNMYNIQHEDTDSTLSQYVKECQRCQNFECNMSNYFQRFSLLKEVGK